jgi:anti-anti-sigma factor
MSFEICPGEAPGVYLLEGELDVASVVRLDDIRADRDATLVLDVERVTFIDSSGLRGVLRLALERDDEHPVVLRHPRRSTQRLLRMTIPDGAPGLRIED